MPPAGNKMILHIQDGQTRCQQLATFPNRQTDSLVDALFNHLLCYASFLAYIHINIQAEQNSIKNEKDETKIATSTKRPPSALHTTNNSPGNLQLP
jgi:hypothetical protein